MLLIALLACVVTELWTAGISWNPLVPERLLFPRTPLISTLQRLRDLAPPSSFRIVGVGPVLFPNTAAMYGLDDIRAHDPMSNGRYLGMMRLLTGYTVTDYFAIWSDTKSGILDYLNVRYIITEPSQLLGDDRRLQLVYDGNDGRIFENHNVLPRFFAPPVVVVESTMEQFVQDLKVKTDWHTSAILQRLEFENEQERRDLLAPRAPKSKEAAVHIIQAGDSAYRLHVDTPRYTLVTSSIPLWPGWQVRANGRAIKPIEVNGVFLGFVVGPGQNDVSVRFEPLSFRIASVAALIALAAVALFSKRSLRLRLGVAFQRLRY